MELRGYVAEVELEPETNRWYGRTVNVRPGGFDFWGRSLAELRQEFAASAEVFEQVSEEAGIEFRIDPIVTSHD